MAFHVRDQATDTVVREVARLRGEGITEAIKAVFDAELQRQKTNIPLRDSIRPLIKQIAARPSTGLATDKAFFDSLNDEGD